jgi:hypothetical protein
MVSSFPVVRLVWPEDREGMTAGMRPASRRPMATAAVGVEGTLQGGDGVLRL